MMTKPGCFVFGGDTLLIECVEILLKKNFEVLGIISRNPQIEKWAEESGVPFLSLDSEYMASLQSTPFDYLFAITHLELLSDTVLDLPAKTSINFHDGPLPQYGGLNAPAWALINQEREYGITWHQMTSGIDEGDILLQERFDLAPDESALSLNTKCFAAALKSFPVLVDMLFEDRVSLRKQDISHRSYFSKYQRPAAACVIDWRQSASELEAQIRALDFGAYPNPIGSMKIMVDEDVYIVQSAVVRSAESSPGKIISIEEGEIEFGTGQGSLIISRLNSIVGEAVSIAEFAQKHQLVPGDTLLNLSEDTRNGLTKMNRALCRTEEFWIQRLTHIEPLVLPYEITEFENIENDGAPHLQISLKGGVKFDLESIMAAFVIVIARLTKKEVLDFSFSPVENRKSIHQFKTLVAPVQVFRAKLEGNQHVASVLADIERELKLLAGKKTWLKDLIVRQPDLRKYAEAFEEAVLPIGVATENKESPFIPERGALLTLLVSNDSDEIKYVYDPRRVSSGAVEELCSQLQRVLESIHQNPEVIVRDISLLSDDERQMLLVDWNQTDKDIPRHACVHQAFEEQVARTPDAVALVFEDQELTYKELDQRANRLAVELIQRGIAPDELVGVYVERSLDMMISTLGVLKAGGAYVPLDPTFPADRIQYMMDDAKMQVIVSQQRLVSGLAECSAEIIVIDDPEFTARSCPKTLPETGVEASHLAYVIYTSGSTGNPKGVMVEHRNVMNFFSGMDDCITHDESGTWLAVTSLSFDISVLELFWTLARGFKVVIYQDRSRDAGMESGVSDAIKARRMGFGLFMWGNDDAPGRAKYRLMLDGAKYFDENGFDAVWTPERHFAAFGGPYPNPAVTGAALAAITNNISIRSGSCVSPLHHAIRIAEDWAVLDNLSDGRVGIGFAAGWQPNDFVIKPENHKNNKDVMLEQIETVRKLWRGESVAFKNPMGEMVETSTLPRPVQKELPVWVTTAGNPETYKQAGELGANVLTHLLGQNLDELAGKIEIYRQARKDAGFDPATGEVTLMLHTFVGENTDAVREMVREPMKDYLRSAIKLVIDFAWSFPAFKRPKGTKVEDVDLKALTEEETETILDFAFERYFEQSGLFGTPETCVAMINRCKLADIDEIACLLDFGVATDDVMDSLPFLKQVRDATNQAVTEGSDYSFVGQVHRHKVTHLQCTPSMAHMLSINAESRDILKQIDHLLVGGEALPKSLANELLSLNNASLRNMYGPTETTIWSSSQMMTTATEGVPIGRPIANTKMYILDKYRQPVPVGVPGELFIGGKGVVRGYLNREELTAQRFIPNPFSGADQEHIYWTGDLARYRKDGVIDFMGRIDHQIKIRGHRIELGEIEAILDRDDQIRQNAVILREDTPGDQRLVAYYVADSKDPGAASLRENLKRTLPDYMVPSDFMVMERLPLTPNGKVDRNALPAPQHGKLISEQAYVAPESDLEETFVRLWQNTLKVDKVGIDDNFFDLGGHSLLIVKLHSELCKEVEAPVSLMDLYRFPTIRSLVENLGSNNSGEMLKKSSDRAKRRREMTMRRRKRA